MAGNLPSFSNLTQTERALAKAFRFSIIASDWNKEVINQLLQGSLDLFKSCDIPDSSIHIQQVPGAYELPLAAQWELKLNKVDAIICLGCIVQGETKHDEYLAAAVSNGIMQLNLQYNKPVIFGVLTVRTLEQAFERAGGKFGNKGTEASIAAIKMLCIHASKSSFQQNDKG